MITSPPGWYADPWLQAEWRWWDGGAWSGYTDVWFPQPAPTERGPVRAGGIAILGFLAGLAISTVIGVVLYLAGVAIGDPWLLVASTAGLWVGLFGACWIAVHRKGTGSLRDLGLFRFRLVDGAIGVGAGIGLVIIAGILGVIMEEIAPKFVPNGRTDITDPLHQGAVGVLLIYFIAVIGAPFFEELFFRGLVQTTLVARWGIGGVIVQALLFASVHLTPDGGWGNIGVLVVITSVGLVLGFLRRATGRLGPGMCTHATYNAIVITIAFLAAQ